MADVLGNPIGYKSQANTDLNETTQVGVYRLAGTSYTNSPSSILYGILMVLRDSTSYGVQICFNNYKGETYVRGFVFADGTFYDWIRIDNFGYNTLSDLANALKPLLGLS